MIKYIVKLMSIDILEHRTFSQCRTLDISGSITIALILAGLSRASAFHAKALGESWGWTRVSDGLLWVAVQICPDLFWFLLW